MTFEQIAHSFSEPIQLLWNQFLLFLPHLFSALLVGIFGYIFTKFIGIGVKDLLLKFNVDRWFEKTENHKILGHLSLSTFIGGAVRWYLFSWFVVAAARILEFDGISDLLESVALWIPKIIIGIIIVFIGIILADVVERKLSYAKRITWIKLLIPIIKFFVIIFFISAGFDYAGVSIRLAENAFLLLFGGIVLTLSLAIGIPLGFALKKDALNVVKKIKKSFR